MHANMGEIKISPESRSFKSHEESHFHPENIHIRIVAGRIKQLALCAPSSGINYSKRETVSLARKTMREN